MNWRITNIVLTLIGVVVACLSPIELVAQDELTDEMRNLFEQIVDDLDPDLQKKFRSAIDENRNTIRFSPDEFKRFRDNPINPFDGIQDINPDKLGGSIELKFELPSLRNRAVSPFERQHRETLVQFDPVSAQQHQSVVEVWKSGEWVAMGTVVDASGVILTKASELGDKKDITVVLHDQTTASAQVTKVDKTNDLAILTIPRTRLTPVRWSNTQPLNGTFLVTPAIDGSTLAIGTYSSTPRALSGTKQGYLGVKPQTVPGGVMLVEVSQNEAAERAGLKNGDVVTSIADHRIVDVTDLVNEIRNHQAGDAVVIEFLREGNPKATTAVLADRNFSGKRAARFKMMNRLGAIPSERADRFPWVFQHDTPLFPEQCGGPILDIDGNVVGINIARGGRAASYGIPSAQLIKILPELLRESVASRN